MEGKCSGMRGRERKKDRPRANEREGNIFETENAGRGARTRALLREPL